MHKIRNRSAGAAIVVSAMMLAGCQQTATAPEGRNVSHSDLAFITGLTNLVEFDHRVIGSEMHRSGDPRVKALAADLLAHVDSFNARVQPIAVRDGIAPPQNLSLFEQSDMHQRIATLMATSKYDFDQEFLSDELAGNRQVLSDARDAVAQPSGDPELRVLINEALVRLQDNITRLETLQAQLKA